MVIAPAAVQGIEAPREICGAIEDLNEIGVDVIIVTRGGGSLEDLFCFNDEQVARTIYASTTPVISAVGHEIDFTIADFVADLRAPTPSAAAELVVPDRKDLIKGMQGLRTRLTQSCDRMLRERKTRLVFVSEGLRDPQEKLADLRHRIEALRKGMETLIRSRMDTFRNLLRGEVALLDTLSPLAVLKRGYGIVRVADGSIIREAGMLTVDESVNVRVASGRFTARVTTISREQSDDGEEI
jgi:exodeoxyribonuclease VII large subunit